MTQRSREQAWRDVAKILRARGFPTADLDARVLLCAADDCSPEDLVRAPDAMVRAAAAARLEAMTARRLEGEPVSRILGVRDFWGMAFAVSPAVLDPRADSEVIVEAVLSHIDDKNLPLRLLDLGTGSGCLLLALLAELPNATGVGIDRSSDALEVAGQNTAALGFAARARFQAGDWLAGDWAAEVGVDGPFDVIVSNPPYIPSGELAGLAPEVRLFDPALALDGGVDGFEAYRAIAAQAGSLLTPQGRFVLEVGAGQADDVAAILEAAGLTCLEVRSDLSGRPRALVAGLS